HPAAGENSERVPRGEKPRNPELLHLARGLAGGGARGRTSTSSSADHPTRAWKPQHAATRQACTPPPRPGTLADVGKASVLIAEDDYNFRDTLEDALVEDGHFVFCARNGSEALVALSRMPRPGLIMLDLHMPIMDGVTFLNYLKDRPD